MTPERFLRLLLLPAAALLAAIPASAQVFGPRTDLNTAAVPRSVEIADVDEDGHPDVIVAVQGGNEVSIFRGNGDLTFRPRLDVPTAINPVALAVVDWTGDGNLDLLVGCAGDTSLTVHVGNGLGQFAPGASVRCPTVPWEIEVGDITGDGILDAVVSADEPAVALFDVPGAAGGGFATPRVWVTDSNARSRNLALGQIDGQPGLDVYLATQLGASRILRNDGAGGLLAPQAVNGSAAAFGVVLGDWSGDGILDAFEVGPGSGIGTGSLRLLRGSAGGTFTLEIATNVPGTPLSPALALLDSDVQPDVALVSGNGNTMAVALSSCGYELSQAASTDFNPADLVLGDLDHDGDPDFVSANSSGASVTIRRNEGADQGCAPNPGVSPPALGFPLLAVGMPSTLLLNVFNQGDGPFSLTGWSAMTGEFSVLTPLPLVVPAHGSRLVQVQSSRLVLGVTTDTLTIATDVAQVPELRVPVSTSARDSTPPDLSCDPALDFPLGPQGTPVVVPFPIANVGEQPLTLPAGSLGTSEFEILTPLPLVIPFNEFRLLQLRTLRTAVGTALDTLRLETNDPAEPSVAVALSATTRAQQPIPQATPPSLAFGTESLSISTTKTFQLENLGELTFAVTSMSPPYAQYELVGTLPIVVAPGAAVAVSLRYRRTATGTHNGVARFFTDDPLHPHFDIAVSGITVSGPVANADFGAPIDYGTVVTGEAELDSVSVRSTNSPLLQVHSLATSTAQFTVVTPAPFQLTAGQTRDIVVRCLAAAPGEIVDTLVVTSNDFDEPVRRIPMRATIIPPPALEFEPAAIDPVVLPYGAVANRTLQVRNTAALASLVVSASTVVDSIQSVASATVPPGGTDGAGTATMPALRLDPEGHTWDVRGDGSIGVGDAGGFTGVGGLSWGGFPVLPTAEMRDGGRAFHLSSVQGSLLHERTIHVSPFEPWVRYLDTVTNLGPGFMVLNVPFRSLLDVALPRSTATSSGDLAFQVQDDWVVVEDDQAPVIAHVVAGPGGQRPIEATLTNGTRDLRYVFRFILAPGGSSSILHYALQAATRAEAIERAEALRTPFGPALLGLDLQARSRVRNFTLGSPFSVPLASLFVPPGGQQGLLVGFDAGLGAGGDETIFGRLRLATNDPLQPLVDVPLQLVITGAPAGSDPLPVEPGAPLSLAARFLPNPARGGRLHLSYVLPETGTARFELFDVRGRRLDARTLPDAPAGPGSIQWGAGARLSAGVVWMRLTQGAKSLTTKAVVLP